ncbi:MAG: hypothetical protein A2169_06295 [Deltaproteobacteria bacterium RBG_13_47_9]|nr:MAG: hypothetical protein A2169_06295 [Deltaproteobacteria bacterium RBG_13_47_9]
MGEHGPPFFYIKGLPPMTNETLGMFRLGMKFKPQRLHHLQHRDELRVALIRRERLIKTLVPALLTNEIPSGIKSLVN